MTTSRRRRPGGPLFELADGLDEVPAQERRAGPGTGGNGPRNGSSAADGPDRPRPRPLRADPPILMIAGRRRSVWPRRMGGWLLFGTIGALLGSGVAVIVQSSQSEPALAPVAQRTTSRAEPAPPAPSVPAPPPSQPAVPPAEAAAPPAEVLDPPAPESSAADQPPSVSQPAAEPRRAPPSAQAPPTQPTPEPLPGLLFVNSRPWGRVLVDGRVVGNTPLLGMPIAPGTHELRVERDGFHPFETTITVDPGTEVRITEIVLRSIIS